MRPKVFSVDAQYKHNYNQSYVLRNTQMCKLKQHFADEYYGKKCFFFLNGLICAIKANVNYLTAYLGLTENGPLAVHSHSASALVVMLPQPQDTGCYLQSVAAVWRALVFVCPAYEITHSEHAQIWARSFPMFFFPDLT